jgi:hypothetical protein
MMPTCVSEANASALLTSVCTRAAIDPKIAETSPSEITAAQRIVDSSSSGLTRSSRNAPRCTDSAP